MANQVFANNMEISCKAADGKSVACFPDVCFTPPQAPPTPTGVPIPYPNTGMAKDTTKGSRTVKITRKEVMLKNKSYFKTSYGDEAGCAPKKGVVTSKIKGKVYFTSWSMDVKFEGENVVRNLDMTTHNHASMPGNSPPWPYIDQMTPAQLKKCEGDIQREQKACGYDEETKKYTKTTDECCEDTACQEARKCMLLPHDGDKKIGASPNCCEGQTAHHIVEKHVFIKNEKVLPQFNGYKHYRAPCVCAKGTRYEEQHGGFHALQGKRELAAMALAKKNGTDTEFSWTYGQVKSAGIASHKKVFPASNCSGDCLNAQIDTYHQNSITALRNETPVRSSTPPLRAWQKESIRNIISTMNKQLGNTLTGY
ncbi:PAAR-like domain-containing protein [Pseudomonas chlororaphis]|uniref:PAAR-like domain-containing protein n=1 Tax=Pseudomonas chlororaphis TaxID=587753 RepID=UPI001B308410|nr:PAAR-like domain-containing protein [Pseudomonas chlororaphis]QTT88452.1 DUF4150 domain-containing protein [Pseudomonas chlororaphis]